MTELQHGDLKFARNLKWDAMPNRWFLLVGPGIGSDDFQLVRAGYSKERGKLFKLR